MDIRWIDEKHRGMAFHRDGRLLWLSVPAYDTIPWLANGFSTRFGGVSTGDAASLNFDFKRDTNPENVRENTRRFASAVGVTPESVVCTDQTHTARVIRVTAEDRGKGVFRELTWHDVDGLITNEPDVALTVHTADCAPVYLVDPVRRAVGLVHSGWRGTAAGIGRAAVEQMRAAFGTSPSDLICAIGPCIAADCYEVSADVAAQFPPSVSRRKENGKYMLDLMAANREVLTGAGVPRDRIFMPNLCTCCNSDLFFSHRASHGRRGVLCALLAIRPSVG